MSRARGTTGAVVRRNLIGIAAIREKSAELDLPMERLLAVYMMEQLVLCLSVSERGERLLLKNSGALSLNGRSGSYQLRYVYVCADTERLTKADFAAFLKKSVKWETQTNINWSWRSHMENTSQRLEVELNGELEGVRIPLSLVVDGIHRTDLTHEAGSYAMRLIMETSKVQQVVVYPLEEQFLDDLGEALGSLELIRDMGVYERLYDALGLLGFEGRQFQKKLDQYCGERQISLDATRYAQMEHYLNYPYMNKKWQAYRKRCRRQLPDWETVYGRFWQFLQPLWSARLQDMIYLGSWIPELGRYLD